MNITMNELLTNPTGNNTAFMTARSRIIKDLENRYTKLLAKHGKFSYNIFYTKSSYIFHVKVPSESLDKLFYDVVIEFNLPEDITDVEDDKTLNRYYLKLFSNSPDFTFTYTYVVNSRGLLSVTMKDKCNDKALKQAPSTRNPIETLGFEKSCYYALLFIKENKLNSKFKLLNQTTKLTKSNLKTFKDSVMSDEGKIFEYNNLKKQSKKNTKKKVANRTATRIKR